MYKNKLFFQKIINQIIYLIRKKYAACNLCFTRIKWIEVI